MPAEISWGYGLYLKSLVLVSRVTPPMVGAEVSKIFEFNTSALLEKEVWNSQATKLSYGTKLCKMMSHFELLTQKIL